MPAFPSVHIDGAAANALANACLHHFKQLFFNRGTKINTMIPKNISIFKLISQKLTFKKHNSGYIVCNVKKSSEISMVQP